MYDILGGNNRDLLLGPNRRCTATNRNGERCGRAPIVGGHVCTLHGGNAPHVRKAARERLLLLVDPAVAALCKVLTSSDVCEACGRPADMALVIRAAQLVLDRCGYPAGVTLHVDNGPDLSGLSDEELAQRLEAKARELRGLPPDEVTH